MLRQAKNEDTRMKSYLRLGRKIQTVPHWKRRCKTKPRRGKPNSETKHKIVCVLSIIILITIKSGTLSLKFIQNTYIIFYKRRDFRV